MSRRTYSLLAWTLFAAITVAAVIGTVINLVDRPPDDTFFQLLDDLIWSLGPIEFAFLAALIISRRPGNVIGWLMMVPGVAFILDLLSAAYLEQFPTPPAALTLPLFVAVWLNNMTWLFLIFPLLFTMLLFPNGRPLSPRWRWVVWAGLGMIAFLLLFLFVTPDLTLPNNEAWAMANPIAIVPAGVDFPFVPWSAALIVMTLLCLAAPFLRYRRATGVEREQIKWLFYAAGLFALFYVPSVFLSNTSLQSAAWGVLFTLTILAIPAAIAIAILRYRLYDIDVIIRKTLLYVALTALLAAVYFGSVVVLQAAFEALTHQSSPVVIVVSTLLIAALFSPLRRRLQTAIDRRFFRQKYDAQLVLAQFALTARDQVELEALTAELERVVRDTVQPESVSIWLKNG